MILYGCPESLALLSDATINIFATDCVSNGLDNNVEHGISFHEI